MARRLSKLTNGETVKLFGEPESGKLWERKDGKAEKPHMPTALSLSLSLSVSVSALLTAHITQRRQQNKNSENGKGNNKKRNEHEGKTKLDVGARHCLRPEECLAEKTNFPHHYAFRFHWTIPHDVFKIKYRLRASNSFIFSNFTQKDFRAPRRVKSTRPFGPTWLLAIMCGLPSLFAAFLLLCFGNALKCLPPKEFQPNFGLSKAN